MKNRFTEEQIIKVLKEHEGGRPAPTLSVSLKLLNRLSTIGSANTAT